MRLPVASLLVLIMLAPIARAAEPDQEPDPKPAERLPVAALVTEYRHNSHADVIVGRLLQGYTLEDKAPYPSLRLASLYTDQVPESDTSRDFSKKYGFPIHPDAAAALTLGGDELAVDGVLLIAEHGRYPKSELGQTIYPKRRLFAELVKVFEKSGRSVPVFCDKHLADNWKDAKWIYDEAERLEIPMMAGSSLPVLWRYPPADVQRGEKLKEIVAVSYHTLDAYGFHALEMVQCLAERRAGGETGVKSVLCLEGDAVWTAGEDGVYDQAMLEAALSRLKRPLWGNRTVREAVRNPVLWVIDYNDGLRASVLTLNGAVGEWAAAWKGEAGDVASTLFYTQEARPYQHFAHLLEGIEQMMHTGRPTWPVERTLLTSGLLDALLISGQKGERIATPHLDIDYQCEWDWRQPPAPPKDRPNNAQ